MDSIALYKEVTNMRKALEALYRKVLKVIPAKKGTDLWWEKSLTTGLEEYNSGKGKPYKLKHKI